MKAKGGIFARGPALTVQTPSKASLLRRISSRASASIMSRQARKGLKISTSNLTSATASPIQMTIQRLTLDKLERVPGELALTVSLPAPFVAASGDPVWIDDEKGWLILFKNNGGEVIGEYPVGRAKMRPISFDFDMGLGSGSMRTRARLRLESRSEDYRDLYI